METIARVVVRFIMAELSNYRARLSGIGNYREARKKRKNVVIGRWKKKNIHLKFKSYASRCAENNSLNAVLNLKFTAIVEKKRFILSSRVFKKEQEIENDDIYILHFPLLLSFLCVCLWDFNARGFPPCKTVGSHTFYRFFTNIIHHHIIYHMYTYIDRQPAIPAFSILEYLSIWKKLAEYNLA